MKKEVIVTIGKTLLPIVAKSVVDTTLTIGGKKIHEVKKELLYE